MINRLKSFFDEWFEETVDKPFSDEQRHLAAAALMIEVAVIDSNFDQAERDTLTRELVNQYDLDNKTLATLIELAEQEQCEATSLYQFTQLVNEEFSMPEKFQLLISMWRIAYADDNLDKYEEHIIRRVADLIHLPQTAFIKAKSVARGA